MLASLLFIAEHIDFQNQNKLSREPKSVRTGKRKKDSEKNQNKETSFINLKECNGLIF